MHLAFPNPYLFKYVSGLKFYMPVWTFEELEKIEQDISKLENLNAKYGGVPRYLINTGSLSQDIFIRKINNDNNKEIKK